MYQNLPRPKSNVINYRLVCDHVLYVFPEKVQRGPGCFIFFASCCECFARAELECYNVNLVSVTFSWLLN